MTLESIEKLRELACDINGNEIVDHMQLYPSCVFDGAWLNSWHCEFDRELEALEREIAEYYMKQPVDADGVPIRIGDELYLSMLTHGKVSALMLTPVGWEWKLEGDDWYDIRFTYHVKPDPVKKLLEEFATDLENYKRDGVDFDCFAERIREAVEK